MFENKLHDLTTLLKEALKVCEFMQTLVDKEKDLLIKAEIGLINENNTAKEKTLSKIRFIDRDMRKKIRQCLEIKGINNSDSFERLLEHVEPNRHAQLLQLQNAISIVMERVKDVNSENIVFADSALKIISGAMGALTNSLGDHKTYQKPGSQGTTPTETGHLVSREV